MSIHFPSPTKPDFRRVPSMIEPSRRRKRAAISCTLCRRRKVRCNRETPCSNCVRSKTASCVYETDAPAPRQDTGITHLAPIQPRHDDFDNPTGTATSWITASTAPGHTSTTINSSSGSSQSSFELKAMQARISELEEKLSQATSTSTSVYSMATSSPARTHAVQTFTSFAGTIDVLQDSRTFGRAHAISRSIAHKNRLFGQSHWMNGFIVFRDIVEMMEPHLRSGSSPMIARMHRSKKLARVIKLQRSPTWPTIPTRDLPPKHVCDRLVNGYIRTIETVYRVLHIPSFNKDYEELWVSSNESSMDFIVLLKLVLAIGATLYDEKFSMRIEATRWVYEAQTWLSSPVFKSRLGIQYLQTSILLLLARELIDVGSELVWISAGSVFRAAVYIGLHKDPAQLPRMTLFEAEMRRRIWNTILEISLQTSLESGGPCFISLDDFNTEPLGNFNDEQLEAADSIAEEENFYTQASVAVALQKSFAARLAVVKFLNDVTSTGTYEKTLRIDAEVRVAYKTLRRALQGFTSITTPSPSQFELQAVDFIMQRYISSLHVPFFGPSLLDPVYAFSRKALVDSSLKIWTLACPSPTLTVSQSPPNPDTPSESDLVRLCRCGAGFFRTFAFHASTFLGVELRAQIQEDDNISSMAFSPQLLTIIDDASNWYLRCIEAGETSLKGYMLLKILAAQVDATKQHTHRSEVPSLLVKAAEEAAEKSLPLLEALAGQEQSGSAADGNAGFDFQMSSEFMEDWDLVMSDVFNFGDGGSFDAFLA